MRTAVVIAEYNPFHNGHRWQLAKMREQGIDHIAVVMSPNFTQRGTPAVFPKQIRAKAALENGADLILELPVCYAMAGAQRFAYGAVQTTCAMGCADVLCFGAEDAQLDELQQAAAALDDVNVKTALQQELRKGLTFAKARELAVKQVFGERIAGLLQKPNNILAVEYLYQLQRCDREKRIAPMAVARMGSAHDGTPVGEFASASYIRQLIAAQDWQMAKQYLPQSAYELYRQAQMGGQTADLLRGERAVLSVLRGRRKEELTQLPDCSEGIENRLYQAIRQARSLQELYDGIKTKRYPLSRVRRLVTVAFLGMPSDLHEQPPAYLRILGANGKGREILSRMKTTAVLPVSASLARLEQTSAAAQKFATLESRCTDQYFLLTEKMFPCGLDYRQGAVFLP